VKYQDAYHVKNKVEVEVEENMKFVAFLCLFMKQFIPQNEKVASIVISVLIFFFLIWQRNSAIETF
jgi:hypothetical protein